MTAPATPEADGLLPCPNPWCKSAVRPMPFAMRAGGYAVICGCDFHGPDRLSRHEAIAAWNMRTPPAGNNKSANGQAAATQEESLLLRRVVAFSPILKAAFPREHSVTRFQVAHALAEVIDGDDTRAPSASTEALVEALEAILKAPMIDHSNPDRAVYGIARAALANATGTATPEIGGV